MYEFVEYVVRGALLGVTYGLLAFPVSLVFITTGSVDVALGAYAVLAVAMMYMVGGPLGVMLAIGAAVLAAGIVGIISMRLNRPGSVDHLIPVLGTFGLATFLESMILSNFGTAPMIRQPFETFWNVFGIRISPQFGINVVVCLVILGALYFIINRTPFGRAMRASAVNPTGASLVRLRANVTTSAMSDPSGPRRLTDPRNTSRKAAAAMVAKRKAGISIVHCTRTRTTATTMVTRIVAPIASAIFTAALGFMR